MSATTSEIDDCALGLPGVGSEKYRGTSARTVKPRRSAEKRKSSSPADSFIAWIANTNALGRMALSENLLGEIGKNPHLEVLSEPMELPFDADGNLPPLGKVWPRP